MADQKDQTRVQESKPRWKRFEEFAASIQKQLAPTAVVKHDDRILGKSGTQRQIDVSIRTKTGQFELLIVMDCKDRKTTVDIKEVEEFAGLVEDVRAHKGALICNAGFSDAAKKRATDKGIDLFSAVDVQSVDWPCYLALPALCDFRSLRSYQLRFHHAGIGPFAMPAGDARYIELFREDGQRIDFVLNLLIKAWNASKLPVEPGMHNELRFIEGEVFTKIRETLYGPVEITANTEVEQRLLFGEWPISEAKGFRDEITGAFTTMGITTGSLNMADVEGKWRRIKSLEELAVRPALTLMALDAYPLIQTEGVPP